MMPTKESLTAEEQITKAFKTWNSKFLVPMLEFYLFSAIKQDMRYGAQLVDMARNDLGGNVKIPTVYAMLKRATENLFLTEVERIDEEEDGPKTRGIARRYYILTETGQSYLDLLKERVENILSLTRKLEEIL